MISRRNIIQLGALAAVGSSSLATIGKAFGSEAENLNIPKGFNDSIRNLTSAHFEPFVNTNFKIQDPNSQKTANLRLLQVKNLENKANTARGLKGESYSLLFRNEATTRIVPRIYKFSHASLGEFSFFVGSVTPDPNLYEVIVNQLSR